MIASFAIAMAISPPTATPTLGVCAHSDSATVPSMALDVSRLANVAVTPAIIPWEKATTIATPGKSMTALSGRPNRSGLVTADLIINNTPALFSQLADYAAINQSAPAPLSAKNQYRGIDDCLAGLVTPVTQGGILAGDVQQLDTNVAISHAFLAATNFKYVANLPAMFTNVSNSNVALVLIFKTRRA